MSRGQLLGAPFCFGGLSPPWYFQVVWQHAAEQQGKEGQEEEVVVVVVVVVVMPCHIRGFAGLARRGPSRRF